MSRQCRYLVLIAAMAMAIALEAGCSTKNPQWLSDPTTAYCASRLDQACLRDFAQNAYTDATANVVHQQEAPVHDEPVIHAKSDSSANGSGTHDSVREGNNNLGAAAESTPVKGSAQVDSAKAAPVASIEPDRKSVV